MRVKIRPRCAELRELADAKGVLSFWAPDGGGYVRLERDGRPGTLGLQICEGGQFRGSTLTVGPGEERLAKLARRWTRAYVRSERD